MVSEKSKKMSSSYFCTMLRRPSKSSCQRQNLRSSPPIPPPDRASKTISTTRRSSSKSQTRSLEEVKENQTRSTVKRKETQAWSRWTPYTRAASLSFHRHQPSTLKKQSSFPAICTIATIRGRPMLVVGTIANSSVRT